MAIVGETASVAEIRKVHCADCGGTRNCGVRGQFTETYDDGYTQGATEWRILQCLGCDHVFVESIATNSEEWDIVVDETGEESIIHIEKKNYFPALARRQKPEWMYAFGVGGSVSPELDKILNEIYISLSNDLNMLSGMGIRSAFDLASVCLGVDESYDLQQKLKELTAKGLIGVVDEANLDALIEMGNATMHRGWHPKQNELNTMMEVLEQFLERAFVIPARQDKLKEEAAKIKARVPPRKLHPKPKRTPKSSN